MTVRELVEKLLSGGAPEADDYEVLVLVTGEGDCDIFEVEWDHEKNRAVLHADIGEIEP